MGTSLICWRQVYRGVLRQGGQQVAVKVQRPGVRESIALDIYILRYLAGQHVHKHASQKVFRGLFKHGALSLQDVLLPDKICCGYGNAASFAAQALA